MFLLVIMQGLFNKSTPSFRLHFFRCVAIYLVFTSLVAGAVICAFSPGVEYIDGVFLAVSACTGTGLGTVEMNVLSSGSFVTIFILMYMGGTVILLLPPMIYRRSVFAKIHPKLRAFIEKEDRIDRPYVNALVSVIRKRELLDRALAMMIYAIVIYCFLWLFCGAFVMYSLSLRYPHPPELESRGFSKLWNAFFLTASCFFNCGYTLTSDRHARPRCWGFILFCTLAKLATACLPRQPAMAGLLSANACYSMTLPTGGGGFHTRVCIKHALLLLLGFREFPFAGSMTQYLGAPGVYLWSSCLILAGNTAAPMCLRGVVRVMHSCAGPLRLDRCVCVCARDLCAFVREAPARFIRAGRGGGDATGAAASSSARVFRAVSRAGAKDVSTLARHGAFVRT